MKRILLALFIGLLPFIAFSQTQARPSVQLSTEGATVGQSLISNGTQWGNKSVVNINGGWDASANTPDLTIGASDYEGSAYIVTVAGTTTLDGIASWSINDIAIYWNGAWKKIPGPTTGATPGQGISQSTGGDFELGENVQGTATPQVFTENRFLNNNTFDFTIRGTNTNDNLPVFWTGGDLNDVRFGSNDVVQGNISMLFWDQSKGSLFVGYTGNGNPPAIMGTNSIAMGYDCQATDLRTVALGNGADATGAVSVAIGNIATASGTSSVAIGNTSQATSSNALALQGGQATQSGATAIGSSSFSSGSNAVAFTLSTASGQESFAATGATANAQSMTAFYQGNVQSPTVGSELTSYKFVIGSGSISNGTTGNAMTMLKNNFTQFNTHDALTNGVVSADVTPLAGLHLETIQKNTGLANTAALLAPMTTTERDGIAAAGNLVDGLFLYNETRNSYQHYDGVNYLNTGQKRPRLDVSVAGSTAIPNDISLVLIEDGDGDAQLSDTPSDNQVINIISTVAPTGASTMQVLPGTGHTIGGQTSFDITKIDQRLQLQFISKNSDWIIVFVQ